MSDLKGLSKGIQGSRRNLIKIGAILAFAVFDNVSKTDPASANCGNDKRVGLGCASGNAHNCFLKSTTIRTVSGDRKIEDLAAGDLLPTVFGGICPIQWIGRYPFKKSDPTKPWVKDVLPVRVARSALGPDVPHADLYVSKTHALLIDDVLVTAGSLLNGNTITLYDAHECDELEFFHIKLKHHDVIYAEGAPCETLLKVDDDAVNFAEYLRVHGSPNAEEARCVPLLNYLGRRKQIRSRFRSVISPWIDRREQFDIIRDKLEVRSISLRRSELMSV